MLMKTYMDASPTTNMKKGWLCRTSYDKKNWEIAPFDRESGSSDDDDDLVMIQLWWWSSDDDPVMVKPWWWSSDDDPVMIQLWWWSKFDAVTKTCTDESCQKNTFLVKRECWCICNFRMYSLIYFILYFIVPLRRCLFLRLGESLI